MDVGRGGVCVGGRALLTCYALLGRFNRFKAQKNSRACLAATKKNPGDSAYVSVVYDRGTRVKLVHIKKRGSGMA